MFSVHQPLAHFGDIIKDRGMRHLKKGFARFLVVPRLETVLAVAHA